MAVPEGPKPAAAPEAGPTSSVETLTLQDVLQLTPQSDFSRFMAPGVDADVRNAAMKKLFFADPHFKTGDELDTYNHSLASAAPRGRMAVQQLLNARALGLIDDELVEQPLPPTSSDDGR